MKTLIIASAGFTNHALMDWARGGLPWVVTEVTALEEADAALILWDGECLDTQRVMIACSERKMRMVTHVYTMASKDHFPSDLKLVK